MVKTLVEEISLIAGTRIAEAIDKVRRGDITIIPGYDGVFGTVKIWGEEEKQILEEKPKEQMSLF